MKLLTLLALLLSFASCSSTNDKTKQLVSLASGEKENEHRAKGKDYMIASQGFYTTKAGKKMFELGGNAVDAAAAISFSISVERPQSTGLGGGGFLLIYHPGMKRPVAFDFREKAPLSAHAKMFLDEKGNEIPRKSLDGIFAVGVPGLVKGVIDVHKRYGKLPLSTVIQPAIDLARNGFKVYPELDYALKRKAKLLATFPSSAKIFFDQDGDPLEEGDQLVQEDLAKTLEAISKHGNKGFYRGWVADKIVASSKKYNGLITAEDLRKYNVKRRRPVQGKYKEYEIFSMGPPSSGGVHVIQILNTVEKDNLGKLGPHHPKTIHLTASAMQQAFADRATYLGDADFVKVPVKQLTSKWYSKLIRKKIKDTARKKSDVKPGKFKGYESDHTTHFSVMDKDGYTVVSTQTINGHFGSGLVAEGTGIVLNNEMDDFSTKVGAINLFGAVGGQNNLVAPQKRPLSSMSPTIVLKGKQPILAVGTPSGTRILTCVAQTILNYIEHGQSLYDSVALTRFHHQWSPDEIRIGEAGLPKQTVQKLEAMGHKVREKNLGCRVQAISKEGDVLHGVSDPRGQGMAYGL